MRLGSILLLILSSAISGAELTGRVEQTADIAVRVRTGDHLVTVYLNRNTEFVSGKASAPGDEIRVDFHLDGKKIIADRVYSSVTVSGTVSELRNDEFWLEATRPRGETRLIRMRPDTVFGASRAYIGVGAEVLVVGWDIGDRSIDAARIAIYGTDVPERSRQR